MHGYELRKRLSSVLGAFHAFSYGSLYPCLKDLLVRGLIAEEDPDPGARASRRSRIVYRLTADGKDRLHELLSEAGPNSWDDDGFGVHFAFFGQTRADVRLRILEGRRSRLEERMESVRAAFARTRERVDSYTLELQRYGLESVEHIRNAYGVVIAKESKSVNAEATRLLRQQFPDGLEPGQGLGLTPGAVQGEHERSVQGLPEGLGHDMAKLARR